MAWIIILILVLLLLILPVGADVSYFDGVFSLKAKAGPFRVTLLPKQEKPEKPKKPKKPKPEKPAKPKPEKEKKKSGGLPKLTLEDVFELLGIVFRLLGRFRRYLSIDRLTLHLVTGAEDPFDAVLLYGRLNAALGALAPGFHRAFRVRDEDVRVGVDPSPGAKLAFEGQLVFSWQIWELLHTVNCAACSAVIWYLRKRAAAKKELKNQNKTNAPAQRMEQKG